VVAINTTWIEKAIDMVKLVIDGAGYDAEVGEHLVDVINRSGRELPQVCYHPQLGPIQTCDTCLVEVNGQLARACGTTVSAGMQIVLIWSG
jgi:formate dehydrogenase major subunit